MSETPHGLNYLESAQKQDFERYAGMLLTVACRPAVMLVSTVAAIDTRANPMFRQMREGPKIGSQELTVGKIRTLPEGSNADENKPTIYGTIDPRASRIGNFLRRQRLDELPQFVGAARQGLWLVGPERPLLESDLEKRQKASPDLFEPWHTIYRPSVTGPAALYGTGVETGQESSSETLCTRMVLGLEYAYDVAALDEDLRCLVASLPLSPLRRQYQNVGVSAMVARMESIWPLLRTESEGH